MQTIKQLPTLQNVAAGARATLNVPLGRTIDAITFTYTGVTLAQLTNIEVAINGKTIQSFASGTVLELINDFYARPKTAGFLTIHFERPEMTDIAQRRATSLGTADVQTLSVSFDIAAGAAAPVMSASARLSPQMPLGVINKIRAFPRTFSTSGFQEIDSLPRQVKGGVQAIHLIKSDVTDVEVQADSVKIVEASKTLLQALQEEAGRVPQTASMTTVDFTLEGDVMSILRTGGLQDFRVNPTLGTSGSVSTVVEYLDEFAGI